MPKARGEYEVVGKASPRYASEEGQLSVEDDDEDSAPAAPGGEKDALVTKVAAPAPAPSGSSVRMKLLILISVTLQNTAYALVRRYSRGTLHETYSTSSVLLAMELAKLVLSAERIVHCGLPSDVPEGSPSSKYWFLLKNSSKMAVPAVIYLIMNTLGFVALAHVDAATFSIVAQLKVSARAAHHPALELRRFATPGASLAPAPLRAALLITCTRALTPGRSAALLAVRTAPATPPPLHGAAHTSRSRRLIRFACPQVFSTAMFSVLVLGRSLHYRKWRALTTLTLGTRATLPRPALAVRGAAL